MGLKTWYSIDHATLYPVGGASVVMAENEERARALLLDVLTQACLGREPFTLVELQPDTAIILRNGDY
jgi:hypothetical protein